MMGDDRKMDEQTLPLGEVLFSFVIGNLRPLGIFGIVSLAAVAALWFLLPRPACPTGTWTRAGWLPGFFNGQIVECERALSAYAVSYDALKRNGANAAVVAAAQRRLEELIRKAETLRAARKRFLALPVTREKQSENANDVLYSDLEEGVCVSLSGCYEWISVSPEKDQRRRTLLAGWVVVNALFAIGLAGWNRRKRKAVRR